MNVRQAARAGFRRSGVGRFLGTALRLELIGNSAAATACSFCGKTYPAIRQVIAGPRRVGICEECIWSCQDILSEEGIMRADNPIDS